MIEICEECGQKYRLNDSVRERHGSRFRCKTCGHVITIIAHVPLNLNDEPSEILASDLLPPLLNEEGPRGQGETSQARDGGIGNRIMKLFFKKHGTKDRSDIDSQRHQA
jgi:predicted Zn finger-like uncharacterized protein